MGLGFTIHTKIKDIEKFQQAVESQAVESGYNAEHDESSSTVSFCRLGDLFLNYQHEGEGNTDNVISVNGDCHAWPRLPQGSNRVHRQTSTGDRNPV